MSPDKAPEFPPLSSEALIATLGLTIKKDNENKLITFLCLLSAYTDEAQFNLSFNAPSSTGKSYIPMEIASLFPKEDVVEIGYCSPQAFFHDHAKQDKEKNCVVDLERKIIIFLDQPHNTLLERLRPLLSHDKKEMVTKITDKTAKGGNRTKTVIIRGFPSVVFCTAGLQVDEQESTRFFLLSPNVDQEKIREALQQAIRKEADRKAYYAMLAADVSRQQLIERIRSVRDAEIADVRILDTKQIESVFLREGIALKPRHQRDVKRLMSLIKAFALLNFMHRESVEQGVLIASEQDITEAIRLWTLVSESQEHNLPPYVYDIYREVIAPTYSKAAELGAKGIYQQDILFAHLRVYNRQVPLWQLRQEILPMLEMAGLIEQEQDPKDKRRMLIRSGTPRPPLSIPAAPVTENNRQPEAGVEQKKREQKTDNVGNDGFHALTEIDTPTLRKLRAAKKNNPSSDDAEH